MEPTQPPPTPLTSTDLTRPRGPDALAVLAQLREDFPQFSICREIGPERIRYVARRRQPGTHPHTLVTANPAELRAALSGPQP